MEHKVVKKYSLPKGITEVSPELISEHRDCECIIVPEGVTIINTASFWEDTVLQEVVLPNSLLEIGDASFWGCTSLAKISWGSNLKKIGDNAFGNCPLQGIVTLPYSLEELGVGAFASCKCDINSENDSFVYEKGALYNADKSCILYVKSDLESFSIPDCVKSIGSRAFSDCQNLTSIEFSQSIKEIGQMAFWHCTALKEINLPPAVEKIENMAFAGCSSLEIMVFPDSVNDLGPGLFWDCESLREVHLPRSLKKIEDELFRGCVLLTVVNIPESVSDIGSRSFYGCSSLAAITIPYSVSTIGGEAFYNCKLLKKVILKKEYDDLDDAFEKTAVRYTPSDSGLKLIIENLSAFQQNTEDGSSNDEKTWNNLSDFFIEIPYGESFINGKKGSFSLKQLIDKFWALCSKGSQKVTLLFKQDGKLYFTKAGNIQEGSWETINNNNSMVIRFNGDTVVFESYMSCVGILILKKTDTDNYLVMAEDNVLRPKASEANMSFVVNHLQSVLDLNEAKEYESAARKQKRSLFWGKVGRVFQILFLIYLIGGIIQNIVRPLGGYPTLYETAISNLSRSWGFHDAGFFVGWLIFMGLYLYTLPVVTLPIGVTWDLKLKGNTVVSRIVATLFMFTLLDCLLFHFFTLSLAIKIIIILLSVIASYFVGRSLKRDSMFEYWWYYVIVCLSIVGFSY